MNDAPFINIVRSEVFVGNPFVNNPHLTIISPYKEIYDRDKSAEKVKASNEIYAIWVMSSPDEKENVWIKLSEEKRKEIIGKNVKINWEDKYIKEGISLYPELCMSIAEKTLKSIQHKLLERDKFLKSSPYTMDYYKKDDSGNYVSRGNSFVLSSLPPKEIDAMIKLTVPLYEELSNAQKLFAIEKDNIMIKGQRRVTDFEDGSLFSEYES